MTRGPHHDALDAWIGRWINEGHVIEPDGGPGPQIVTSDVYEWAPGGLFVLHTAYGRVGDLDGGAIEIIGCDEGSGDYRSHLFDHQGTVSRHRLTARGDTWTYRGDVTRSTVEFSDGHRVQTVLHERTADGTTYHPASRVTLVKVG